MYYDTSFFPNGMSVMQVVIMGERGPLRQFQLKKSQLDLAVAPLAWRADGSPVLGPNVYRLLTRRELKQAGVKEVTPLNFPSCLISLCNTASQAA